MKFKYNQLNFYTHFSLLIALDLGLKMTLIDDEKPNFMYYKSSGDNQKTMNSSRVFADYIKYMVDLKNQHKDCVMFKLLSSSIHGVLNERYVYQHKFIWDKIEKKYKCKDEIQDDEIIDKVNQLSQNTCEIKTYKLQKFYKSDLGRIYNFIVDKQKSEMYFNVIKPYENNIIRFATDGFLLNCKYDKCVDKNQAMIGDIVFNGIRKNFNIITSNNYTQSEIINI